MVGWGGCRGHALPPLHPLHGKPLLPHPPLPQAAISAESAVFNTAVLLLSGCVVSLFFLLPGVNPDAGNTPAWSVVSALVLSAAGVVLWKRWELETPLGEQFSLRSIREDIAADEMGDEEGKGEGDGVPLLES